MLSIDPGAVGGPSNSPILAGHTVFTSDPFLDIVFSDMKHVEATQWGIQTSSGANFPAPTLVQFFLTDEFGDMIPGTGFIGPLTGTSNVFNFSSVPIIAHDFHVSIELPVDIVIDVFVDGRVGEWAAVPEPSTLTLWSLGAVALAGLGWRRRKRAA